MEEHEVVPRNVFFRAYGTASLGYLDYSKVKERSFVAVHKGHITNARCNKKKTPLLVLEDAYPQILKMVQAASTNQKVEELVQEWAKRENELMKQLEEKDHYYTTLLQEQEQKFQREKIELEEKLQEEHQKLRTVETFLNLLHETSNENLEGMYNMTMQQVPPSSSPQKV